MAFPLYQRCILIVQTTAYRFLLVSLSIDAILAELTITKRKNKLEEMARGNGLSDAYTEALRRLREQGGNESELGMKVLMWVHHSERPLHADELCHALGVEMGSEDLDLENLPDLQIVLSSCCGLVTVDASSSVVRLVHFSLQEYLLNNSALFQSPHSAIAEVCLTYLNFSCLWDLSPTPDSVSPALPLEEYASCYWEKHARIGMTEKVRELVLMLLNRQAAPFGRQFVG